MLEENVVKQFTKECFKPTIRDRPNSDNVVPSRLETKEVSLQRVRSEKSNQSSTEVRLQAVRKKGDRRIQTVQKKEK